MNIGITIFATKDANIWSNGLNQNIAFLVMCFRLIPEVEKIYLLNGGDADVLPEQLNFEGLSVELVHPQDVTHQIDFVIVMGATVPTEWLRHIKALGKKVVSFHVGQPYVGPTETTIFERKGGAPFSDAPCDEVWLLPQYMHSSAALLRTVKRVPVLPMPHIWEPYFLEHLLDKNPLIRERFGYQRRPNTLQGKPWRVAIMEPNISVAKNCVVPMLICEQAYRTNRTSIELMMVLNSFHMKEHLTFNSFARYLDLSKDSKASYEPRLSFLDCMVANVMDALVSHQWENAQNYVYYEALYGGYPLIHNSPYMRDAGMGFYYPEFSAKAGAQQLLHAWSQPDEFWGDYKTRGADYLKSVSALDAKNVESFRQRMIEGG